MNVGTLSTKSFGETGAVLARNERGFSLIEVMVSLVITISMLGSVFLFLKRGQSSFRREYEVADMNATARAGIDRISQDLTHAGFNTPPELAVLWSDGGENTPDTISILYAHPDFPTSRPKPCGGQGGGQGQSKGKGGGGGGGGPCNTIGSSAVLNLDPYSFSPVPVSYEDAYHEGLVLYAIQAPNGEPACENVSPGITAFEVTQPPKCTGAGGAGSGPEGCATLNVNHNPGKGTTELNLPGGFHNDVSVECAVIGVFHIVQYRVNPLPPATRPSLERRDLLQNEPWSPVSGNIEDLQFQYMQGSGGSFEDVPAVPPTGSDPSTWVTAVRVEITGRSRSTNLEGATEVVYAAEGAYLRRTFATTTALRNQLHHVWQKSDELGVAGWN